MMSMKKFSNLFKALFLFLNLLPLITYGGQLTSINNDTCWYKEEEFRTKIASFNDLVSIKTNRDDILAPVVKHLHQRGFDAKRIDAIHTYGLCGPQLQFAFRVNYDSVSYCLRASVGKEGNLLIDDDDKNVSLAANRKGACEGVNPNKLIVSISSDRVIDLQKHLKKNGYKVKEAKHLTGHIYVLNFAVSRDEIIRIKESIESTGLVNSVSFSSGQYHIADEFELLSLSYFRQ